MARRGRVGLTVVVVALVAVGVVWAPGGGGAVREIAERILRARGTGEEVLARYHQA